MVLYTSMPCLSTGLKHVSWHCLPDSGIFHTLYSPDTSDLKFWNPKFRKFYSKKWKIWFKTKKNICGINWQASKTNPNEGGSCMLFITPPPLANFCSFISGVTFNDKTALLQCPFHSLYPLPVPASLAAVLVQLWLNTDLSLELPCGTE